MATVRVRLIDADELFTQAATQLMAEMGIGYETYTPEEMRLFARDVADASADIWDEFMLWVACGNDKRERMRMMLKVNRLKQNHIFGY